MSGLPCRFRSIVSLVPPCALLGVLLLLSGCETQQSTKRAGDLLDGGVRAENCKTGDDRIADRSACLLDDAACYQLVNGAWCTGPRGNVCPAGSSTVPAGQACPVGEVCFQMGESLTCVAG